MAVQPNDPFPAATTAETWTYHSPIGAPKLDPGSIENNAPVAAGNNFYLIDIDAQVAKEAPADMLAYQFELAGVTMDQAATITIIVWTLEESEVNLTLGAYICDATSSIGTSNGNWFALSRETSGVGGNVDGISRLMNQSRPTVSPEPIQYAAIVLTYHLNPVTTGGWDSIFGCSSTGVIDPTAHQDNHGQLTEVLSPGTTGAPKMGFLIGCRGGGSASATAKIRVATSVSVFPS